MKKHLHKIAWVEPGSIAEELGLEPGDAIEEIDRKSTRLNSSH